MLWISLLALHVIGLTGYTLLLRKSALGRINKVLLAALMQTAVFIPTLFVVVYQGGVQMPTTTFQWLVLLASAFLIVGIQLAGILVLKYLEASQWTIIFNLRLFLTTILGAIFLQEFPPLLQIAGGVLIFISILALGLHKEQRYKSRGVVIGLAATLLFSVHATVEKYNIIESGLIPYMVVSGGLATLILWGWVAYRRITLAHAIEHFDWHMIQLLGLRILSAWGYIIAIQYGSLAVSNYVSGMSVVFIVIAGVFLLGEREHLREKFTALGIAVLGLSIILIGRVIAS